MRERLIEGGWGAVHISCSAVLLASRNRSSRFTDYQFRFDRDRGRVIVLSVDSLQQSFRGHLPHADKRLANSGERGNVKGRARNVIKAVDRYILRNSQTMLQQRANGSQ